MNCHKLRFRCDDRRCNKPSMLNERNERASDSSSPQCSGVINILFSGGLVRTRTRGNSLRPNSDCTQANKSRNDGCACSETNETIFFLCRSLNRIIVEPRVKFCSMRHPNHRNHYPARHMSTSTQSASITDNFRSLSTRLRRR